MLRNNYIFELVNRRTVTILINGSTLVPQKPITALWKVRNIYTKYYAKFGYDHPLMEMPVIDDTCRLDTTAFTIVHDVATGNCVCSLISHQPCDWNTLHKNTSGYCVLCVWDPTTLLKGTLC